MTARVVRVVVFASVLVLGATLVRGITEALERAVHGAAPVETGPNPSPSR